MNSLLFYGHMVLIRNFIIFLFFIFSSVFITQSFDVRVLLHTTSDQDLSGKKWDFKHKYGFVIMSEQDSVVICEPALSITWLGKKNAFMVNGQCIQGSGIEIFPRLSAEQLKKIKHTIGQWSEKNKQWCLEQIKVLDTLFYGVCQLKKEGVSQHEIEQLLLVVDRIAAQYLYHATAQFCAPESSYQMLYKRYQLFMRKTGKAFFSSALTKELTKKVKRKIHKQEELANLWCTRFMLQISQRLLTDFMMNVSNKVAHQVIQEETGIMSYQDMKYSGSFVLHKNKSELLCINVLDMNDYLVSVLHAESWPTWPLETQKVMAVASRTYLVSKILEARTVKRPYHIMNSISHQTYKGYCKDAKMLQAVLATKDEYVAYNGNPIVAMFDVCCGGIIPGLIQGSGINFKAHPYLARKVVCNHCKKFKLASWKAMYSKEQIQQLVPDIGKIRSIKVTQVDKAGLPSKVLITGSLGMNELSGRKVYSMLPKVKSYAFAVKKTQDTFVFSGKGYGHHMGLCQWGAYGLVLAKWSYKKILAFYYPGTTIMKLSY